MNTPGKSKSNYTYLLIQMIDVAVIFHVIPVKIEEYRI